MNDLPRQKLQFILSQYGRSICDEPKRCEGMLKDLCNGECKREITVLIGALRENVAKELLTQSSMLPIEAIAPKLTQRLYDDLGIAEEFAQWAVETWALALGLLAAPLPTPKKSAPRPVHEGNTTAQHTPGQNVTVNLGQGVTLELLAIPGGTFLMGSPNSEQNSSDDERPQHRVTLQPFLMGKYPVTQAQWQAVMGKNPSKFNGADRPVENVSWNDCQEFLKKLNANPSYSPLIQGGHPPQSPLIQGGQRGVFRLPTEAEWEYACRAGSETIWHFGDDPAQLGTYAWFSENSGRETHPVGQKSPNAFGLYDMHGNVWEWCADTWHEHYTGAPTDGTAWESGDADWHVLRGGSWYHDANNLRCAVRGRYNGRLHWVDLRGFRLVCSRRV